ncbi:MAG: ferredoxin--NADP reductase [Chitinophagaceae bacterium]|nr:MAG: ferredoxin--NADP reductase [Chitinophagaceae bacterium]
MNPNETFSLRVNHVRRHSSDVVIISFEPDPRLQYKPGQFLTFVFREQDGEHRRSYSFCSIPETDTLPAIAVKRIQNGRFSRRLFDVRPGDMLQAIRATGQFLLPEPTSERKQIFLFGAGIGITPLFSMIKHTVICRPDLELILVYSNTSPENTLFLEELRMLQDKHPHQLFITFLFSNDKNLIRARLNKQRLGELIQDHYQAMLQTPMFYTCGPFAYMRMVIFGIEEMGFDNSSIRRELFDTGLPIVKIQPPDTGKHRVTLLLKDGERHFDAGYPLTILQAAKASGIPLPYSCETGKCGSCTMTCVSGSVWMSYNEVLTANDQTEGKFLSCTAFPVHNDVTIR